VTAVFDVEPLALSDAAADLLFREARTANSFTDEQVTEEQLAAIYDLTKWGPTALNSTPLRVVLVRTDEARARLLPHIAEFNRAKTAAAPLVAILAADTEFTEHLSTLAPHLADPKAMFADDSSREQTARFNATLQIGYFLIGIRAAGLAAGPMGGFDAAGLDAEFFADGRLRSLVVVNIGHAGLDAFRPRGARLPFDQAVTTV